MSLAMGVNRQHRSNTSRYSPPTMFHPRLQNEFKLSMSTLFATVSVVVLVVLSYTPSIVLCAAAKNDFAGANVDYLADTPEAAGTEDTPNPYHASKHKDPVYKVHCSSNEMLVDIVDTDGSNEVYLQHLKKYPDKACKPERNNGRITFRLNLANIYECMVTKVVDKESGRKVYYHHVIIERTEEIALISRPKKHAILVKCDSELLHGTNTSSYDSEATEISLVKRSAQNFPPNFQEPDYEIEITSEVTGRAPTPQLSIGVKQSGFEIDEELTVKPGTPLNMEIYLDEKSKDIYGLLIANMRVTDTKDQEENLIINGCTIDPYLFENFLTEDGNYITAKFKAFKFPESNFVRFEGVVNVCLDTCPGVECSNGQIGFGRRKREVDDARIYEVSMSTIIKVAEDADDFGEKPTAPERRSIRNDQDQNEQNLLKSQSLLFDRNFRSNPPQNREQVFVERAVLHNVHRHPDDRAVAKLSEEFSSYKYIEFEGSSSSNSFTQKSRSLATVVSTTIICLINLMLP